MWTELTALPPVTLLAVFAAAAVAAALVVLIAALVGRRRARAAAGTGARRLLIGVAIMTAIAVAIVGGVRSFEAVSHRFGSPLVPLTADGMIVACTALRIAALTRGWRIPGVLGTTYLFLVGTVWLNVAAAHDWSDAIAHALAPISYAILVEMLAHLLRLHLRLATPPSLRRRIAALTWATSPIMSTRAWIQMARTGSADPVAARALVQQLVRLSSRLRAVCPDSRPWPFGHARRARTAALHVARDGLLTAHDLADLLPTDGGRLSPAALLSRVDNAALRCTTPTRNGAPTGRTAAAPSPGGASPRRTRTSAPSSGAATRRAPEVAGTRNGATAGGSASDEDLVSQLHRLGGPLSGRQVMKELGVGTGRAKRLIEMAGWTAPGRPTRRPVNGTQTAESHQREAAETETPDRAPARTSP